MGNFDDMKLAVEALTGGKNTVVLDDIGMPSIIVVLPTMYSDALITGATQAAHPGFVLDNVVKEKVGISKYKNIIMNSRAYSLPMQDPRCSITWQAAQDACRAKGEGWGLTPFSLWGAIALWCKKNGTMPHGNNNYGSDITYAHERGVATTKGSDGRTNRVATGSGPATWYHDHTPAGIDGLNGNCYDWLAGFRLRAGEIQIIPYANCMSATCDMSVESAEWKAIMPDGTLVAPGTSGTLKLDYVSSHWVLCTTITSSSDSSRSALFQSSTLASGVTCPQILKELAVFPADSDGYEGDYLWANNAADERFPIRGGHWAYGAYAGVFHLSLSYPRSHSDDAFGFRSAFYGEL